MAARAASSSVLTEQDSPSPRSVDEEEEPVDQAALRSLASYAPPSCSLVIVAAVAAFMPTPRLQERLPTEILSAIISFDYLTWPALDVCSPVSRRLRQIALPERGAAPPVEISIISGSGRYSWTVEAPSSRGCWAHARRHRAYGAKLAEDLLCEESLGEDEADYLPDILNAFPNVRSLRLEGCEYFSTADSVEYLVECLPNLREVMTIATRAERGRGPEDGKDSSDQSAEEELGQALEEEGIRFIPLKY
ncbi:hypothetical protein BJY59DRAFT_712758 [Rhodotorula toruloides]